MHPIDIRGAVHKAGLTLVGISRAAKLSASACGYALKYPSPRAEAAIAAALGVAPNKLWPDRYDASGRRRIRARGRRTRAAHISARRINEGQ